MSASPRPQSPLLTPWKGPHGGLPPFASVNVADFEPAFAAAMDSMRKEIKAIESNPAPPDFDNTFVALEAAGRTLDDVEAVYGVWSSCMNDAAFQAVERTMAPKLAAFSDEITQNGKLFARVQSAYNTLDKSKLSAEQQRLAWKRYTGFVRAGAKLDDVAKKRLAEINQRLA